jgi:hypothetical protein
LNNADSTSIIQSIADKFMKALDGEIQEKVLCHGLEMFGLWSTKFNGELDAKIVQWFKKGLESKSQAIKVSYLQWFQNCLQNASLPSGVSFSDQLVKIVEKASQNVQQTPLVCEGLAAASIMLTSTNVKQDSLQSFWNIVLDMNKEIFLCPKNSLGVSIVKVCVTLR